MIRTLTLCLVASAITLGLTGSQSAAQSKGHTANKAATSTPVAADAIRPYRVHVSKEAIADLRRRIATTRWPDKETVSDNSQGAQLENLKELVKYWGTGYDWHKAEARLNALPQF